MKFKDRFNRSEIKEMPGVVYVRYCDYLPNSIWLDGDIFWCNGYWQKHRPSGPSITNVNGNLEYWLKGKKATAFEIALL